MKPTRRFTPRLPEVRRQPTGAGGTEQAAWGLVRIQEQPGAAALRLRSRYGRIGRAGIVGAVALPPLFDPVFYEEGTVTGPPLAGEVRSPNLLGSVLGPNLVGTVKGI